MHSLWKQLQLNKDEVIRVILMETNFCDKKQFVFVNRSRFLFQERFLELNHQLAYPLIALYV